VRRDDLFLFDSRGIKLTSASRASLIIAVMPVVTVAAEAIFFHTRISWLVAVGIALSVVGVLFVVGQPGAGSAGTFSPAGDPSMFGACAA
jgi:drug/metabolite transporter (DMT)-like permease